MNGRPILQTVLTVVLAVLFLLAFFAIGDLRDSIDSLRMQYVNDVNDLRREIEAIYDNVDARLKEQASLILGSSYDLGELDAASNSAEVTVTVVPKVYTDDMTATISFGGVTAEAVREDDGFKATIPVGIFGSYDEFPLLTLTADGETKTEYLEDVDLSYLHEDYLPILLTGASGGGELKGGELTFTEYAHVSVKAKSDDGAVSFVKYELVAEKNGTEIARQDFSDRLYLGYAEVRLEGSYPAVHGDEIAVYAVAEDSLGYVHKALAHYWKEYDGAVAEVVESGERIFDKDGNLLN